MVITRKIKDIEFTDLMIMDSGTAYLRNAAGLHSPVTPLSKEFDEDVNQITKLLLNKKDCLEFAFKYDGIPYRVARINSVVESGFFLRRPKYPVPKITELGFLPAASHTLLKLGKMSGLVLIAGATCSGKTTTIYSLLQCYVSHYGDIVIAIEDPPEIPMQGIYGDNNKGLWFQIDTKQAGGYSVALVSALRYNPRVIFIGEIRTPEVANEAIRAAVNGHLVLSTINSNSIYGAILALQQLASIATNSTDLARSILADGLLCVIHQQLNIARDTHGKTQLGADMLCFDDIGVRSKIRSGKIEMLSSDIERQRIKLAKRIPLFDD